VVVVEHVSMSLLIRIFVREQVIVKVVHEILLNNTNTALWQVKLTDSDLLHL
jgi:hypothetical protein